MQQELELYARDIAGLAGDKLLALLGTLLLSGNINDVLRMIVVMQWRRSFVEQGLEEGMAAQGVESPRKRSKGDEHLLGDDNTLVGEETSPASSSSKQTLALVCEPAAPTRKGYFKGIAITRISIERCAGWSTVSADRVWQQHFRCHA